MTNKKRVFIVSLVLFFILALMSFVQAQTNSYQFTVSNNGDETEIYELSTDFFSEYMTFSENPAYIDAKGSKTITLTATVPCEKSGGYSLNFILYAQKSKETIKIPFDLFVASCSGYEVQFGEEVVIKAAKAVFKPHEGAYELCEGERVSIPVLITNKDKAKNFRFELDDIGFAELSGKKLFLKQNQRGVLYIALEPKDKGNYSFNLNIITDKVNKIPIDLRIKQCIGVYFAADNLTLCGCELYSYDFFVRNEEYKKAEFGLELEGPEWLSLGLNQNFELEPDGVIAIALNIDAPCRESETYDANIITYLADQKDVRAEDSVSITIVEDCFETRIETEEMVNIDYNGVVLPVKVANYGSEQMVYSISLEGPEWVKLDSYNISLEPGDEKTINLDIKPGEDIEEGNYEIKISLDSEKASYSKDIEVKLKEKTNAFEELTEFYDSYSKDIWTGALVVIVIIVLLFLVLSAKKIKIKKIKVRTKKKIKKVLLRLFLVILALAILGFLIKLFGRLLWDWIMWFRYYIYTIIVVVIIIYLILRYIKNIREKRKEVKKQKKIEEKKKAKKSIRKKKRRYLKYFLIIFIILVLAGIFVYFSLYYNLMQYIAEFLLIYYQYFIAGIVILIILILLLKFSTRKKKNKKKKEN